MFLNQLYQEMILDHNRKPRNFRALAGANHTAEGYNPLCGDRVTVYLRLESDVIQEISFQGSGCAISTASASLMTESLKGKTLREAEAVFKRFHSLVTGSPEQDLDNLGKLAVFQGVSEFPIRVKCATLAWHTLQAALSDRETSVSTE